MGSLFEAKDKKKLFLSIRFRKSADEKKAKRASRQPRKPYDCEACGSFHNHKQERDRCEAMKEKSSAKEFKKYLADRAMLKFSCAVCGEPKKTGRLAERCEATCLNYEKKCKERRAKGYQFKCGTCELTFETAVNRCTHEGKCPRGKKKERVCSKG